MDQRIGAQASVAYQSATTSRPPSTQQLIEQLSTFDGPPEMFLAHLLAVQCHIGGADHGALFRATPTGQIEALAVHPPIETGTTAPVWLAHAAEIATSKGDQSSIQPLKQIGELYGVAPSQFLVGLPLAGMAGTRGYAAFVVATSDAEIAEQARQRLELTTGLLSLYEMRLTLQRRDQAMQRLKQACTVLSELNSEERYKAAAMSVCNQIAAAWGADRVTFGLLRGRYVKAQAMSHTDKFTRKTELVQSIEAAMEECVDQDVEVPWPISAQATTIARAAEVLGRRDSQSSILTLPLRRGGRPIGAITIERAPETPFVLEEVEGLRLTCDLCTARLTELSENDRWFGARWAGRSKRVLAKALGPTHTWVKVATLAAFAAVMILLFVEGPYRVEAPFVIEATQMQVVSAPFEGKLSQVLVEPGDSVVSGKTILAKLDTSELEGQLAIALSEVQTNLTDKKIAEREQDIATSQIAAARADQARARANLLQLQISQASIRANISGIVLTGDLKTQLGARMKQGQTLFEIAPLEGLRAKLGVEEKDVQDVLNRLAKKTPTRGELAAVSYPGDYLPFEIERIAQIAEVSDQHNVFQTRVKLLETRPWLRPRMEGVAKIDIDRRSYAAIWSRDLIAWIRMKLWF